MQSAGGDLVTLSKKMRMKKPYQEAVEAGRIA
jgi:hypothetical protein